MEEQLQSPTPQPQSAPNIDALLNLAVANRRV